MRLVYVVNDDGFFLSHRLDLANAARSAGYDVHVAVPEGPKADKIRSAGFVTHDYPLSRFGLNPLNEWETLRSLSVLFRELQPNVVHLLSIKPVIYGSLAARWQKVAKVVCSITGLGPVFSSDKWQMRIVRAAIVCFYKWAFSYENLSAIFQNEDDLRLFVERKIISEDRAVLVRGSGVDPDRYVELPEPSGTPVVILASRMLWNKGIRTFVDAARLVTDRGFDIRFAMVGAADNKNPEGVPQERLQAWNDAGEVEWWGFQSDMLDVFARSTIVCLPSYYREGVPKVLIEAASCGRAIISTEMPGCRDIVLHNKNGILVQPREPEKLADAIIHLAENPALRKEMGERGRQRVIKHFSLDRVIAETLATYQ